MNKAENVFDVIKNDQRFSILSKILVSTGIGKEMAQKQETFTFFAPTDEAFNQLSERALEILMVPESRELVAAILGQHLISGSYLYSIDLRHRESVKTLQGTELKIKEENNTLLFGRAHILTPGVAADNGVVFPVDKVLPVRRKVVASL